MHRKLWHRRCIYHEKGHNWYFPKFVNKSIIQISQNCEEELCIVSGPILIKYQVQISSQSVAEVTHLSRQCKKLTFSKICQKIRNSNFTKLWRGIVHSVWTYPYKTTNLKSIINCSRGVAFIKKMGKIDIFKNLSKNQ